MFDLDKVKIGNYWRAGILHRTNGPAIERANGYKEWWIDGICRGREMLERG